MVQLILFQRVQTIWNLRDGVQILNCMMVIWGLTRTCANFKWHPGMENRADYQSKHHPGAHHTAVRPYYLHEENSPLELPRAIRPSTLKGCVGTLKDGYVRNVPLPRVVLFRFRELFKQRLGKEGNFRPSLERLPPCRIYIVLQCIF